ncbi:HBL/NHE enterotoxin family protein [Nostoc sp.]|uniref:HBL/NHE enterotoxin family protein n=1 Tax=Nostoc sp. TaxID=1180 RepID=UPI002FF5CDF6
MSDPKQAAQGINAANKAQSSQALIIQTYANSINEQPTVDFSGEPHLATYQTQINTGLATAQTHSNNYLNVIQPNVIQNIANIGNYYALNNAVATTLPEGSTEAQWIESLTTLQIQSASYQNAANGVVTSLQNLHSNLTTDAASFAKTVSDLNIAVNGDNGILASDNKELSSIQGKIDGAIAGIVTSALAILGGSFMIAVGGIADFVTAGTTTPLVAGGIGIVAAGVGGEVASAITLKSLNDQKATLLTEESTLTAEVKLATGISSGYQSLLNQVKSAVDAATQMENAWEFLSSDLGSMISDLQNGVQNAGQIRTLFLTAANTEVQTVIRDINTIKGQMDGVQIIVAKSGQTVGEALVAAAQQSAAAKVS